MINLINLIFILIIAKNNDISLNLYIKYIMFNLLLLNYQPLLFNILISKKLSYNSYLTIFIYKLLLYIARINI